MRQRVLLVCPGRGTYTPDDLGFLVRRQQIPETAALVESILDEADALRADRESKTIREIDGADRYSATLHLKGENAGPLIYTCSAVDAAMLPQDQYDVVAVCGNSMGWYTALHVGGAFDFDEAFSLVDVMSHTQRGKPTGGQIIIPICDEEWRPDPERRRAIEEVLSSLRDRGHFAGVSIELGGYLVLAGDDAAVSAMKEELPKEKIGEREFPFQLAWHAAFHTELMDEPARIGQEALRHFDWRAPERSLVDGSGRIYRPGIPDGKEMFDYTLGEQVLQRYDFTHSLRVALREFAPERIVLLGPGQTLGGAIGQTLVLEGWQGIRSKSDFLARQESDSPILISMGREDQFERFIRSHLA